jgi:hypothetical protein
VLFILVIDNQTAVLAVTLQIDPFA